MDGISGTHSRSTPKESLLLAEELLQDIELSRLPLSNIALKAARLARLTNDHIAETMMSYEAGGYPSHGQNGQMSPETYQLAVSAGRQFSWHNPATEKFEPRVYLESIGSLQGQIETGTTALSAAADRNVSFASSNPNQWLTPPPSNSLERARIQAEIATARNRLSSRTALVHRFVRRQYYELKLSGIATDIFARAQERVNKRIDSIIPEAATKLASAYDRLRSDNPEDWSGAVHTCRRIFEELADKLYPAANQSVKGDGKEIKGDSTRHKNRLMLFVESKSKSKKFNQVVGSHLSFLGERLDAVVEAANKGSHSIVDQEEADRYVVYTYLLLGDILSLIEPETDSGNGNAGGNEMISAEPEES